MEALIDDGATLRELSIRSTLSWLSEVERRRDLAADADQEFDESEHPHPPDILQLLARTCSSHRSRIGFDQYMLTWDDGMWIRWAFEKMARKMPRGNQLGRYLEADRLLEKEGVKCGRGVAARWIEWSAGRELSNEEVRALSEIWNRFAPLHNEIERIGPQRATAGIDDQVDDVHIFALHGDPEHGDRSYPIFWHEAFRVVLVPDRRIALNQMKFSSCPELLQIANMHFSGFVAPVISSNVWELPFLPWLRSAPERCDVALANFLRNPNKRFPARRAYDGPQPASEVHRDLSRIDEFGDF